MVTMSTQACATFLREAADSAEIQQQLKAMTGTREIVKLGRRYGYAFDITDLAEASSAMSAPASPTGPRGAAARPHPVRPASPRSDPARSGPARSGPGRSGAAPVTERPTQPPGGTTFLHHEYKLADVPGLAPVLAELPKLKVRPDSVDLTGFNRAFVAGDLDSTDRSPADPEFRRWHAELAARNWKDSPDGPRRDFHLINLDEHIDHPGYDGYFDAKVRTVDALEKLFGTRVRFSGSLWYPPASYRLWHTNETQPGWRMYVVDFDDDFPDPAHTSFFRYQNPGSGEIVTLPESRRIVRFFKAEQDPDRLFWHCIVNPTTRHRWSFGFVVPDDWMDHVQPAS